MICTCFGVSPSPSPSSLAAGKPIQQFDILVPGHQLVMECWPLTSVVAFRHRSGDVHERVFDRA